MTDAFDYTDLLCPLPILRVGWTGDGVDEPEVLVRTIDQCGDPLDLIITSLQYATVGGIVEGCHPHWEVKCRAGHVVFTYDDEGNDYDVPFDHADLVAALAWMRPA
jgi:hypothetical protein